MVTRKDLPPADLLRAQFRYEPETGKLFWRVRRGEKEAFTSVNGRGYHHGKLNQRMLLAHRIIWKIVTGREPDVIDHINGVKTDNRFFNLRSVTYGENSQNRRLVEANKSGVTGVRYRKRYRRWVAQITINQKQKHLGHFNSMAEAIAARKAAEFEYGFHRNHGKPALKRLSLNTPEKVREGV